MERQRINMDLDKRLWEQVGIMAIKQDINKRELVEKALKEYIKLKEEVKK